MQRRFARWFRPATESADQNSRTTPGPRSLLDAPVEAPICDRLPDSAFSLSCPGLDSVRGSCLARGSLGAQGQTKDVTPEAENQAPFRLRAASNLVVVRVVVRDVQGRPVEKLKKEDFKLFDRGKEQSIAQFEVETALPPLLSSAVALAPGRAVPGSKPARPRKLRGPFISTKTECTISTP
jgi:hypothetical protein